MLISQIPPRFCSNIKKKKYSDGFPQLVWSGQDQDERQILVMELLSSTLESLLQKCKKKLSLKSVLMIADQMVHQFWSDRINRRLFLNYCSVFEKITPQTYSIFIIFIYTSLFHPHSFEESKAFTSKTTSTEISSLRIS